MHHTIHKSTRQHSIHLSLDPVSPHTALVVVQHQCRLDDAAAEQRARRRATPPTPPFGTALKRYFTQWELTSMESGHGNSEPPPPARPAPLFPVEFLERRIRTRVLISNGISRNMGQGQLRAPRTRGRVHHCHWGALHANENCMQELAYFRPPQRLPSA